MADFIMATELDAYNVGQLSNSPSYTSNLMCRKDRAIALGCKLNSPSSGYSDNEIVRKDDLVKATYQWSLVEKTINTTIYNSRVGGTVSSRYIRSFKIFFGDVATLNCYGISLAVYRNHQYTNLVANHSLADSAGNASGDNNQTFYWRPGCLTHNAWYTDGVAQVPSNPMTIQGVAISPSWYGSSGSTISVSINTTNINGLLSSNYNCFQSLSLKTERTTGLGINNRWVGFDLNGYTGVGGSGSNYKWSLPAIGYPGQTASRYLYASYILTNTSSGNANDITNGLVAIGQVDWVAVRID